MKRITILFLFFSALIYISIQRIEVPQNKKIIDIVSHQLTTSIILPKGHLFQILLYLPYKKDFKGSCTIKKNKKIITTFNFNSNILTKCNWLQSLSKKESYILTWKKNTKKFIQEEKITISINFNTKMPKNTSLWLSWLH